MTLSRTLTFFLLGFVAVTSAQAQSNQFASGDWMFDYRIEVSHRTQTEFILEYNKPIVHYSDSGIRSAYFDSRQEADQFLASNPSYSERTFIRLPRRNSPYIAVGIRGNLSEASTYREYLLDQNAGLPGDIQVRIIPIAAPIWQNSLSSR